MFYFNNHATASPSFPGEVADVPCLCVRNLPAGQVESSGLTDATHGAIHLDDEELDQLKDEWSKQPSNLILLRVSVGGQAALTLAAHEKKDGGAAGPCLYILSVRNHSALTRETVEAFSRMTAIDAEAVLAEKLDAVPEVLRELFRKPREASTLIALSILCQGYLTVNDPAKYALSVSLQETLGAHDAARKVNDPWWWLDAFGCESDKSASAALETAAKELRTSVAKEWEGSAESREPVDALLESFSNEKKLAVTVLPALTAIRKHLESSSQSTASGKDAMGQ